MPDPGESIGGTFSQQKQILKLTGFEGHGKILPRGDLMEFTATPELKEYLPSIADYDNVFVCGDSANGASLVVRAIASGRQTARKVDEFLK